LSITHSLRSKAIFQEAHLNLLSQPVSISSPLFDPDRLPYRQTCLSLLSAHFNFVSVTESLVNAVNPCQPILKKVEWCDKINRMFESPSTELPATPMADINSLQPAHPQWIPWWVYIIIAVVVYIGLTYVVPALPAENHQINTWLHLAPKLAPIITIAFLLLGAKALYREPGKKATSNEPEEPGQ
jgi:hypothetical protein